MSHQDISLPHVASVPALRTEIPCLILPFRIRLHPSMKSRTTNCADAGATPHPLMNRADAGATYACSSPLLLLLSLHGIKSRAALVHPTAVASPLAEGKMDPPHAERVRRVLGSCSIAEIKTACVLQAVTRDACGTPCHAVLLTIPRCSSTPLNSVHAHMHACTLAK